MVSSGEVGGGGPGGGWFLIKQNGPSFSPVAFPQWVIEQLVDLLAIILSCFEPLLAFSLKDLPLKNINNSFTNLLAGTGNRYLPKGYTIPAYLITSASLWTIKIYDFGGIYERKRFRWELAKFSPFGLSYSYMQVCLPSIEGFPKFSWRITSKGGSQDKI